MPIQVRCPNGHKLNVPRKRIGSTVQCPACQASVNVPSPTKPGSPESGSSASGSISGEKPSTVEAPPVVPPPAPSESAEPLAPPPVVTPPATDSLGHVDETRDDNSHQAAGTTWTRLANQFVISNQPGYAPDAPRRGSARWLAFSLGALGLFSMIPVYTHLNLTQAPSWVQVVILLAVLQIAYAVWLALAPDWSSLRVAMIVACGVATIYAAGVAINFSASPGSEVILDLGGVQQGQGNKPALWCGAIVLLAGLVAYLCGLASFRWHKAYQRLTETKTD